MFRELHPTVRLVIFLTFLTRVIGSMIFPFMAIYFTLAMNATIAGILLTINVIVQFIASLYGGYLTDTFGRRRMLIIGEVIKLAGLSGVMIANSPWWVSPWTTFAMLVLVSVSSGIVRPAAEALLIDLSTKETRAFMFSINYWATNMSIMLGLIVGGWFFKTHLFELLAVMVSVSMFTLWMSFLYIKESLPDESRKKSDKPFGFKALASSYYTVVRDIPFIWFTLGGIAILSIEFQRNNFIAVRLEKEIIPKTFDIFGQLLTIDGVRLLSLLTVENTLMIVLFTAITAKWIKNKPLERLMYIGFILFGLGYGFLAFSNNIAGLFIAVIVLSIGELLYVPARQTILADIIDDSQRGAYMAFNGFIFQVGKIFGSLGIIVGEKIGGYGMGVLYVLFIFLGISLTWIGIRKKENREKKTSLAAQA